MQGKLEQTFLRQHTDLWLAGSLASEGRLAGACRNLWMPNSRRGFDPSEVAKVHWEELRSLHSS